MLTLSDKTRMVPSSPATIQAIANRLGVSAITVSRALRGLDRGVRRDASERAQSIRKVAQEMGYRTNSAARAARTGRFGAAALVTRSNDLDFFPYSLVRGLCDTLADADMHLIISRIDPQRIATRGQAPKIARELTVDGLLIHEAIDVAPEVADMIRRHRVPAVWLNTRLPADSVHPDDLGVARSITQQLIALGHRRILFLEQVIRWPHPGTHYSVDDRRRGYEETMVQAGLSPNLMVQQFEPQPHALAAGAGTYWGGAHDQRLQQTRALLSTADRPTAIVCPTIDSAAAVVTAAISLGLQLPRDLSLVVIHHEFFATAGLPISTLIIPMREVGEQGVRMLMEKMSEPTKPCESKTVAYTQPIGNTIASASSAE